MSPLLALAYILILLRETTLPSCLPVSEAKKFQFVLLAQVVPFLGGKICLTPNKVVIILSADSSDDAYNMVAPAELDALALLQPIKLYAQQKTVPEIAISGYDF